MSDYVSLSFGEFNYGSFRKFHYSLLSMIIAQNRESYGIISPSEITLDVYLRGVDDMRQPSCALSSRQLNYREFPLIFLNHPCPEKKSDRGMILLFWIFVS